MLILFWTADHSDMGVQILCGKGHTRYCGMVRGPHVELWQAKLKFTLDQATKAQSVNRGIDVLFI
jgi:hypothetical protein